MDRATYRNIREDVSLSKPVLPLSLLTSAALLSAAGARSIDPLLGILAREAMGIAPEVGMGAIRFSLGRTTTDDEIDATIDRLMVAIA
jgi:cysteine sulfinate desulfinase/cysteine desulfurase-like protein